MSLLQQLDTPISAQPDVLCSANGDRGTRRGRGRAAGVPAAGVQCSSQMLASELEGCFSKLTGDVLDRDYMFLIWHIIYKQIYKLSINVNYTPVCSA